MPFKKGHKIWLGKTHSEESKKKMSTVQKGKTHSAETRKKISVNSARKGKPAWNTGKTGIYSEETKKKMGVANIGKKHLVGIKRSAETRKKISLAGIGRPVSEETKKKHRAYRGEKHFMYGKHLPAETKEKIRKANLGKKLSAETRKKMSDYRSTPEMKEKFRQMRLHRVFPKKDSKIEVAVQKLLKENSIVFEKHKPIIGQPDIFIKPNVCIFVDGDYWHANPKKYDITSPILSSRGLKPAYKIWEKDEIINQKLIQKGYKILRLWEDEIKNNPEKCLQKIIKIIKK